MATVFENGINVGPGINIGNGSGGGGGTPGVNNVTGYNEMPPPVTVGGTLEDPTATVNGSIGFTINDDNYTGIAMTGITASNQAW